MLKKVIGHFTTITRHKILVMKECFKIGLYKQGLTHDLSKYSPTEFLVGCKYYQGNRSPNNAEREETGVSKAWLHHKGRNRHHFEYWIDYSVEKDGNPMTGMPMPRKYIAEMMMDRMAASKIYNGKNYNDHFPLQYYEKGKHHYMMHPQTEKDLEKLLKITGIWLSFPVTETATFVLALLIFRAGRKKETLCSGTKTQ